MGDASAECPAGPDGLMGNVGHHAAQQLARDAGDRLALHVDMAGKRSDNQVCRRNLHARQFLNAIDIDEMHWSRQTKRHHGDERLATCQNSHVPGGMIREQACDVADAFGLVVYEGGGLQDNLLLAACCNRHTPPNTGHCQSIRAKNETVGLDLWVPPRLAIWLCHIGTQHIEPFLAQPIDRPLPREEPRNHCQRGIEMRLLHITLRIFAVIALSLAAGQAHALDHIKLAVGAPGNWDTCVAEVGKRAGIFQKYGLELETLYTNGGGETMQAVISGGVDIGIAAGTAAAMAAYVKGAPVRILLAGTTGTGDLFWYVPVNSPIKSFSDTNGKTAAYSTNGASTHTTLLALIDTFKTSTKPVATGASAITLTQAMTNQIDVGWASPPFGLKQIRDGEIRVIARGSDAPSTRDQTVRVHIVNAQALSTRKDAIDRFAKAYRESLEYLYGTPEGLKHYADYAQIDLDLAKSIRDEFMPKAAMNPDRVSGIEAITKDAIAFKVLQKPLSDDELKGLIQIPAP